MENDKLFDLMSKMYSEMQTGFKELREDVSDLKEDVSGLKQDVSTLKEDVSGLKQQVTRLEISIEHDIKPKVSALFDGYKQNSEQLTHIAEEVAKHEEVIIRRVK